MLRLEVPGASPFLLEHLVLDYNGTLAVDGELLPGVAERLAGLAATLAVHVVTADTFGSVHLACAGFPRTLKIIGPTRQGVAKLEYLRELGEDRAVAVGNGANDEKMLRAARLGIALVQAEGASAACLGAADVVAASIQDALDLLEKPGRLAATLRT